MRNSNYIWLLLLFSFLWHSCAVEQAPLGGPKDETPPVPDSLRSTPNNLLFFEKQAIELVFNEWVKLKSPGQIVVSPPLEFGLEAKLKKKSLFLEFDDEEVLQENTTYTINLGQSIVDYTVGNAMDNYTYVFSTGSYIDSLSISGVITDDKTGEPIENIIVSLYNNLQDTAFFTTRPLYFSRTNELGQYKIRNVKSDTFRVYTLDDKNSNYFRDQVSEGMGFLDSMIFLDTAFTSAVNLGFYEPQQEARILGKSHQYGALKIAFNRTIDDLDYEILPPLEGGVNLFTGDSLFLWYQNETERKLFVNFSEDNRDTLNLIQLFDSIKYKKRLALNALNATSAQRLSPLDTLILTFNTPIQQFDKDLVVIKDTSGQAVPLELFSSSKDKREIKLKAKWKEGIKYELQILPSAFVNHYEVSTDTIDKIFFTSKLEQLGEIIFVLDSLDREKQYLVELIKGDKVIERLVSNKNSDKFTIKSLLKGKYVVRVTEDINNNGRWDPGNFLENRYSEKWITKELDELKSGWTLEVTINGDEFK